MGENSGVEVYSTEFRNVPPEEYVLVFQTEVIAITSAAAFKLLGRENVDCR